MTRKTDKIIIHEGNTELKKISRLEAKFKGLKYFYTGRDCKHGHDAERAVASGGCRDCIKSNNKEAYDTFRKHPRGTVLVKVRVHRDDETNIQKAALAMRVERGLK